MEAESFQARNGKSFKVRPAAVDDYDESIKTFAEVASEKVYLNTETIDPNTKQIWLERWQNNTKNSLFCVAEMEGKLVGGIVLNRYSRSPKTDHVLELGIWILKDFRKLGIGGALFTYARDWAMKAGFVRKIVLGVFSNNLHAIHFYLSRGFRIEGNRRDVALINGNLCDEILMSLDF